MSLLAKWLDLAIRVRSRLHDTTGNDYLVVYPKTGCSSITSHAFLMPKAIRRWATAQGFAKGLILMAVCRKGLCSSPSLTSPICLRLQPRRMASTLPKLTIFQAVAKHDPDSTAVIHSDSNQSFSYGTLLRDVASTKKRISKIMRGSPLQGERIAFFAENNYNCVGT